MPKVSFLTTLSDRLLGESMYKSLKEKTLYFITLCSGNFIYLFIHLFIYLFIYLFIRVVNFSVLGKRKKPHKNIIYLRKIQNGEE